MSSQPRKFDSVVKPYSYYTWRTYAIRYLSTHVKLFKLNFSLDLIALMHERKFLRVSSVHASYRFSDSTLFPFNTRRRKIRKRLKTRRRIVAKDVEEMKLSMRNVFFLHYNPYASYSN